MEKINVDAPPGDPVHITATEMDSLKEFGMHIEGVGFMSRIYEEITHQQHMAQRWFQMFDQQQKLAFMWRLAFLITTGGNLLLQLYRLINR